MGENNKNRGGKLWFIHIPKTGGTFLRNYFKTCDMVQLFSFRDAHAGISKIPNYKQYYTFGFIRNPWDYRVAQYFYPQRINANSWLKTHPTFEGYVRTLTKHEPTQVKLFHDQFYVDGEMMVNYIGRFETLHEDIKKILEINEIEMEISIDEYYEENKNNVEIKNNSPHKHYSSYYTDELRDLVYNYEKEIIDKYEYKFEKVELFENSKV